MHSALMWVQRIIIIRNSNSISSSSSMTHLFLLRTFSLNAMWRIAVTTITEQLLEGFSLRPPLPLMQQKCCYYTIKRVLPWAWLCLSSTVVAGSCTGVKRYGQRGYPLSLSSQLSPKPPSAATWQIAEMANHFATMSVKLPRGSHTTCALKAG